MLKEIRALWRDGSMMRQVVQMLGQMVADAGFVHTKAWEVCIGPAVAETVRETVRDHDKAVNRGEREIRRMVVEHLSINPGEDVSGCLAVLLMAKDVERLGDHGRNIFSVGMKLEGAVPSFPMFEDMQRVQTEIAGQFPRLERAILDSDEALAHDALARYKEIKKSVKGLQRAVFESDMQGTQAVGATLLARYLRRTNAHIGNAASGVIFPLENIDFVSRGLREEEKDR